MGTIKTVPVPLLALLLVVPVFICLEADSESDQATVSTKTRQILSTPDAPIDAQLRPDDDLVIVQRGGIIGSFVDDSVLTLSEELDQRSRSSDVIVVAELAESESFLSENGSWIRTKMIFRPLRVIKDTRRLSGPATSITVFQGGGEVRINTTLVRAGNYYVYRQGPRYLLFLRSFTVDNNALTGSQLSISAEGRLEPMEVSTGRRAITRSPLNGLQLDAVIEQLTRRLAPKGQS